MSVTTMSVKGQIVVPEEIRRKLGLRPRQKFRVELTSRGNILVLPIPSNAISEMKLEGVAKGELSAEVEEIRKESEGKIEEAGQRLR